jgi:hypothetical protein
MTVNADDILDVTKAVTRKWTKQRKAEERGTRSFLHREETFSESLYFTDLAPDILPAAYQHASGGGKYSVGKRQLYYASREEFKQWTGREISANYFSNTLLVQFINRHPDIVCDWKITADPRGTLTIPNSHHDEQIPCGTLAIEEHLEAADKAVNPLKFEQLPMEWPSLRHGERYKGVLYIEKEGFEPQLQEAKIAERYDLAIVSCKGQSVVAARHFVDEVCRIDGGVPLYVVHDFDKAGFEISQRLTTVSQWAEEKDRVTYRFQNEINVTDLGLRLADVEEYRLGSETVEFKGNFAPDSIATTEEQQFLRSNRRVELNAFTSPQFIEWLEAKLREHGLGDRLIPGNEVLEAAYRRAIAAADINLAIDKVAKDARRSAKEAKVPKNLKRQLQKAMDQQPDEAWDRVLYRLAETARGKQ